MMRAPILPFLKNLARQCGASLHWGVLFALLLALLLQAGSAASQTRPGLAPDAPPPTTDFVPPPPPEGEEPYDDAQFMNTSMPSTMEAGSTRTVTIMMRNTGSTVWSSASPYPYLLGSKSPENNVIWGVNRANVSGSHPYGANVTFTLNVKAPSVPGTYSFDWQMVRENQHWFGNIMSRTVTVTAPAPVYDAQFTGSSVPTTMAAGSTYNVALTFKNTGNVTWNRSENYRIGTSSPIDNTTFGTGRVDMGVASVAPGQSATFNFQVKAPATAGSYLFDWGMLWEGNWRFGQTSAIRIAVNAAATKPTVDVFRLPSRPVAGQAFITTWGTTGATSLTQVCAAAGTGYKVSQALSVNGTRTETAQQAWVGYPSTCVWTATGPGGTATYTEQVETVANTSSKPVISVTRNPAPVAGQSFTTAWTTSNATSLTRVCTATGTGYKVNESLAVNDSRTDTALAAWVGYPSSCTWTASGAGGTTTHVETMTTTDAASGGVTYIHTDGLGSPVARTNAAGQVISRTRYEPYGYVAGGAAPTVGFTGHVNDAETGLTYMQQRYYDPVAGRFLSIDPVVTDASTGGSFNRYSYSNNSPYNYIDPDGRNGLSILAKAAATGIQGIEKLIARRAWRNSEKEFIERSAVRGPNGGKICPDCKNEVDKFDINHRKKWGETQEEIIERARNGDAPTRAEVRDMYGKNIDGKCASCNRADNKLNKPGTTMAGAVAAGGTEASDGSSMSSFLMTAAEIVMDIIVSSSEAGAGSDIVPEPRARD